ncbi:MAG: depupylase/deamidase Dop [Microthrixaceae bacterium]
MAIPKICGIETEYGIALRGVEESNPITTSSLLINAYLGTLQDRKIGWDFEDETPARDARGDSIRFTAAPEIETNLVNAVLTNGARYYVDHAHPEYSAPECKDALQALVYDRAGEETLLRSMQAASRLLPAGQEVVVYKNNSDGKGNSYGCHENYLMDRAMPFPTIVVHATTHFVTRQIFIGAGKVGSEMPGSRRSDVSFQLTQRADFFEEEVGLETTLKRPIVNTRDEPHADAKKYRRLHVIAGDANMSEVATFLKLGTTAIVLAMAEDGEMPGEIRFARPVQAMHQVSRDLSLSEPLQLIDGRSMTALEIQWELLHAAQEWSERHGLESVGFESGAEVLARWEEVLSGLETDPMSLSNQLDWVAKYRLFNGYRERHDLDWANPRLAAMDLQYHDLRAGSSLARRVGLERLTTDEEVATAISEPPPDTRAYFRGRCLSKFGEQVVAANWDSMVFDTGDASLQRVPMMEPGRGTQDALGRLIDEATSAKDLLERLRA